MAQRLLVDGYGDEIEWAQCDPCADVVLNDDLSHGFAYGLEVFACHRCSGETTDPETLLLGTGYPSAVEPYNHYYEKVVCYPREVV